MVVVEEKSKNSFFIKEKFLLESVNKIKALLEYFEDPRVELFKSKIYEEVNESLLRYGFVSPEHLSQEAATFLHYFQSVMPIKKKNTTVRASTGGLMGISEHDTLFTVRRLYTLTGEGNTGSHMHFIEKEYFQAASGVVIAKIHPATSIQYDIVLYPGEGLYVMPGVFHSFTLTNNAVLVAMSSTHYNPTREDYMEDFNEYKKRTKDFESFFKWLDSKVAGLL